MRKIVGISFIISFMAVLPVAAGLIPTPFPKTVDDLTFQQRMDLLTEGYEPFDTVFEGGVCVKNCPYVGITIEEFNKRIELANQQAIQDVNAVHQQENANVDVQNQSESDADGNNNAQQQPWGRNDIPMTCPLKLASVQVTSEYGKRNGGNHNGVDLGVPVGTPVYAAASGTVVINQYNRGGYGYYVVLKHAQNYYTVYGHLKEPGRVKKNDQVTAGQLIGYSGNTGNSTGPHLHYEVLKNKPLVHQGADAINPRNITECPWDPANRH